MTINVNSILRLTSDRMCITILIHMGASFRFQVFPSSGVPIYRQIMDQVRQQVAAGRLPVGGFLPSVRQLAQDLQVNPMTISKAYSLLEREGVVESVRGQGMRVLAREDAAGGVREREQALVPLLRQVVASAYQLSLDSGRVKALLEPLLKDLDRHGK
jgi:GntR family transcriptional regulator